MDKIKNRIIIMKVARQTESEDSDSNRVQKRTARQALGEKSNKYEQGLKKVSSAKQGTLAFAQPPLPHSSKPSQDCKKKVPVKIPHKKERSQKLGQLQASLVTKDMRDIALGEHAPSIKVLRSYFDHKARDDLRLQFVNGAKLPQDRAQFVFDKIWSSFHHFTPFKMQGQLLPDAYTGALTTLLINFLGHEQISDFMKLQKETVQRQIEKQKLKKAFYSGKKSAMKPKTKARKCRILLLQAPSAFQARLYLQAGILSQHGFKAQVVSGVYKRTKDFFAKNIMEGTQSLRVQKQSIFEEDSGAQSRIFLIEDADLAFKDEPDFQKEILKCLQVTKVPFILQYQNMEQMQSLTNSMNKEGIMFDEVKLMRGGLNAKQVEESSWGLSLIKVLEFELMKKALAGSMSSKKLGSSLKSNQVVAQKMLNKCEKLSEIPKILSQWQSYCRNGPQLVNNDHNKLEFEDLFNSVPTSDENIEKVADTLADLSITDYLHSESSKLIDHMIVADEGYHLTRLNKEVQFDALLRDERHKSNYFDKIFHEEDKLQTMLQCIDLPLLSTPKKSQSISHFPNPARHWKPEKLRFLKGAIEMQATNMSLKDANLIQSYFLQIIESIQVINSAKRRRGGTSQQPSVFVGSMGAINKAKMPRMPGMPYSKLADEGIVKSLYSRECPIIFKDNVHQEVAFYIQTLFTIGNALDSMCEPVKVQFINSSDIDSAQFLDRSTAETGSPEQQQSQGSEVSLISQKGKYAGGQTKLDKAMFAKSNFVARKKRPKYSDWEPKSFTISQLLNHEADQYQEENRIEEAKQDSVMSHDSEEDISSSNASNQSNLSEVKSNQVEEVSSTNGVISFPLPNNPHYRNQFGFMQSQNVQKDKQEFGLVSSDSEDDCE